MLSEIEREPMEWVRGCTELCKVQRAEVCVVGYIHVLGLRRSIRMSSHAFVGSITRIDLIMQFTILREVRKFFCFSSFWRG